MYPHKSTQQDHERGYKYCDYCKDRVHIYQAGYEVKRTPCGKCGFADVATASDFESSELYEVKHV